MECVKNMSEENQINKSITLSSDELYKLLIDAYRNGYASYEIIEAGLEPYDADGYANWILLSLTKKDKLK